MSKIIYTLTDEAPFLATASLLPIIQAFLSTAEIQVQSKDISLAGRILAQFPECLPADSHIHDALEELGKLTQDAHCNIIKLPNISASIPQLVSAINELQNKGFKLPNYPDRVETPEDEAVKKRYSKILGSAVNPVLREGNSDRRAPNAVKAYARKNPHHMGKWNAKSKTHVSSMSSNDFYGNELSKTIESDDTLRIVFVDMTGITKTLKEGITVGAGDIIDGSFISAAELNRFLEIEIDDAKHKDVLFSLHLKATMMKVSDPIIFGAAVKVFFKELFDKHQSLFQTLGANPNNGFQDIIQKINTLDSTEQNNLLTDIETIYKHRPHLAMVNSDKGITNLHVPSDVIIDASMPAMIREGGQMWGPDGALHDVKAVIPDRCYAGIYEAVIEDCKKHGAFDPATMGSVPNVGLMAQKAEEYGSHDKTFEIEAEGTVEIRSSSDKVIMSHVVEKGDIWRMCIARDVAIQDWIQLTIRRVKESKTPAIFWLDDARPHDFKLIKKVCAVLEKENATDIQIMPPKAACLATLERVRKGLDTISVTGNVLRDYNTDLFPILELGTSAKMLSIVPLMNGGGLFETGAGGSAPKHVEQLIKENHLRWDSLGEFLALSASLAHLATITDNKKAKVLAETLDTATETLLNKDRSPSRKVGELDNRGSHFYLALYWAEAMMKQADDADLSLRFTDFYRKLESRETDIVAELIDCQGKPADIGGYYFADPLKVADIMRPSDVFDAILSEIK